MSPRAEWLSAKRLLQETADREGDRATNVKEKEKEKEKVTLEIPPHTQAHLGRVRLNSTNANR